MPPPITLQHETGPIVGSPPAVGGEHAELSGLESLRRGLTEMEKSLVESDHQLGSGFIVDKPQADQGAICPGQEDRPGEADQPFPPNHSTAGRVAGAEHHQLTGQVQVVDLVHEQTSVKGATLLINP